MRFKNAFVILLSVLLSGLCMAAELSFTQSFADGTDNRIEQLFTDSDIGLIEQLNESGKQADAGKIFFKEDVQAWQKHCGDERTKRKVANPAFRQIQDRSVDSDLLKRSGLPSCSMKEPAVNTEADVDSNIVNANFIEHSGEFYSKSDDEQAEIFKKIFEAVMAEEQKNATETFTLEIDGMVLDETRSKTGRVFYDLFYSKWQLPDNAESAAIRITEKFIPGSGSIISVEVNQSETFRARLQPAGDMIEQAVDIAIQKTHASLANAGNYAIY